MSLEFEKLGYQVEEMAQSEILRREERRLLVADALEKLHRHATDWDFLDECLELAIDKATIKKLRAARPLDRNEPLDVAVPAPRPPARATLIATDGSQILPNHHAAHLYSLINVGVIIYGHGLDGAPEQFTRPTLDYPGKGQPAGGSKLDGFTDNGGLVNLRRDRAEIETLARTVWEQRQAQQPLIAILDQRLLYWPAAGSGEAGGRGEKIVQAWQEAMTNIRLCDGLLVGYLARSLKQSVLTMLAALDINDPNFEQQRLTSRDSTTGLTDAWLFSRLVEPGQRSKVFIDVSQHNNDFRDGDPLNEVCFFYLNPGQSGRLIARVDLPMWVAGDPDAVDAVHALIIDQCQILGDYPYVLARADEIAVVGRRDQENLNLMIDNVMHRHGITALATAKQGSKDIARAGRTRHEL
jgi:hypothetical protein